MAYSQKIVSQEIKRLKIAKTFPPQKKTFCEKIDGKIKQFFMLFLDSSSIHGLNHFTRRERHPLEIILWLIIVIFAMWGTISLSQSTWKRYQDSPTVVSMDRDMFAWNTTFPCVTICPHTKLDSKKLEIFMERSNVDNKEELETFLVALAEANYSNFGSVPEYPKIDSKDYMGLILNLSFIFQPILTLGASGIALQMQPTITELGLCYTVNSKLSVYNSPSYRAKNRWDFLEGNETFFVHPLDGEIFAQIINMSTGYDVFLHGPLETPDIASQRQTSENGFYMKLYVTALSIYTSAEATKLTVAQRKCRFHRESNLAHSPVYSYNLCRIDCRITLCQQLCGCIPHFYRAKDGEKICDVSGLHCLKKHEEILLSLINPKTKKSYCECAPNCDDVNYVVQSMSLQYWFLGTNLQWGMVSYPKMRFRRDIIFGFTDVLVSVGGMAGLFLGCSLLSFMEIVYFFSLRLFWYLYYTRGSRNRVQNDNMLKF